MVRVNVNVPERVDELADAYPANLRNKMSQQGVTRDVERHAQERIRPALIELARQTAVGEGKLTQGVAGRQRHLRQVSRVPGRDNQPTTHGRRGVFLDGLDPFEKVRDLVERLPIRRWPGPPLFA